MHALLFAEGASARYCKSSRTRQLLLHTKRTEVLNAVLYMIMTVVALPPRRRDTRLDSTRSSRKQCARRPQPRASRRWAEARAVIALLFNNFVFDATAFAAPIARDDIDAVLKLLPRDAELARAPAGMGVVGGIVFVRTCRFLCVVVRFECVEGVADGERVGCSASLAQESCPREAQRPKVSDCRGAESVVGATVPLRAAS